MPGRLSLVSGSRDYTNALQFLWPWQPLAALKGDSSWFPTPHPPQSASHGRESYFLIYLELELSKRGLALYLVPGGRLLVLGEYLSLEPMKIVDRMKPHANTTCDDEHRRAVPMGVPRVHLQKILTEEEVKEHQMKLALRHVRGDGARKSTDG